MEKRTVLMTRSANVEAKMTACLSSSDELKQLIIASTKNKALIDKNQNVMITVDRQR